MSTVDVDGLSGSRPAWSNSDGTATGQGRGAILAGMPPGNAPSALDIGILGSLECRVGAVQVGFGRRRARSVLVLLAAHVGRIVSTDTLIDVLYGRGSVPADPGNGLQIHISQLRKLLAAAGAVDVVETHPTGYRLAVEPTAIDAVRFDHFVHAVLTARDELTTWSSIAGALGSLESALALWRGAPLAELEDHEIAIGDIERLRELHGVAGELRVELLLTSGRHQEAVATANALIAERPYSERLHEFRVIGLYRSGRQADALRAFTQARSVLIDQLGVEPGAALQAVEQAVLDHDPVLDWVPPAGEIVAVVEAAVPVVDDVLAPAVDPVRPPASEEGLIGRGDELARLGELVRGHRLVTITGPGGAGKTRLGAAVAGQLAPAWYVDLDDVTADDQVELAVAGSFGVSSADPTRVLSAVHRLDPAGIVVIDTCEHVIAGAARAARSLVDGCPHLRVLAISRRPLELRDEVAWPVPPLDLPELGTTAPEVVAESAAVALFVERARAVQPQFALDVETAADVAAICRSLDGLPLAIELAAARADVMSPAEIRDRLDDRFRLLRSRSRDARQRQRSLRATLDWSMDLLDPDSRRALDRLAVVPASFGLDLAIECVGDDLGDPLDVIEDLVRHSLVARRSDGRFHLLDSIRLYVNERAAVDDQHRAALAIMAWVEDWTAALAGGSGRRDAMAALRREGPVVKFAVEWSLGADDTRPGLELCAQLAWYWTIVGDDNDGRRWMEIALRDPLLEPRQRVAILLAAGALDGAAGRFDSGWDRVVEALVEASRLGFDALAEYVSVHLVSTWWSITAASDLPGRSDAGERPDWWPIVLALLISARSLVDAGDVTTAIDYERLAALLAPAVPDPRLHAMQLEVDARLRAATGDASYAELAHAARDRCIELSHDVGRASVELFLAQDLAASDPVAASAYARSAADLYERIGHTNRASAARALAQYSAATAGEQSGSADSTA